MVESDIDNAWSGVGTAAGERADAEIAQSGNVHHRMVELEDDISAQCAETEAVVRALEISVDFFSRRFENGRRIDVVGAERDGCGS